MAAEEHASQRSALWVSMALLMLGSCGSCNGMSSYANGVVPSESAFVTQSGRGAVEMTRFQVTLAEVFVDAPNRRPLGLVNVVVSMMLIAGGFMLSSRRPNARWFVVNALMANMVFIATDAVIMLVQLDGWRTVLISRLIPWIHVISPATPAAGGAVGSTDTQMAESILAMFGVFVLIAALIKLASHAYVLRSTKSAAITAFLNEKPEA